MENNLRTNDNKKIKILMAFFVIFVSILVMIFLTMLIFADREFTTCTIEYVGADNKVLVQSYSKGEKVNLPDDPTKSGYEFLGWTFDREAKFWVSEDLIVKDEMTLYAQWQKKTYELKYNNETYLVDYNCSFYVEDNCIMFVDVNSKVIKLQKLEKDGYDFVAWELSDDNYSSDKIEIINLDNFKSNKLLLKEKYKARTASFIIFENNNYSITNLSHENNISVGETLKFDVVLDKSVNKSDINIVASNGVINKYKLNNAYRVEVTDFTQDFEVKIDNIDINDYTISFPKNNGQFLIKYAGDYLIKNTITKSYLDNLEFEIVLSAAYNQSNVNVYTIINGEKIILDNNKNIFQYNNISSDIFIYIDNVTINTYSVIVDNCDYGKFNYGSFISITDEGLQIQDDVAGRIIAIPMLYQNKFVGWQLEDGGILVNSTIQDIAKDGSVQIFGNYIIRTL